MSGLHRCVLDLVCGLPSPKRERWQIMALKAFADDSLEAGCVLVLAGYISTAERWSNFSNEWGQRLSMRPRLRRFKMSEVDLQSALQMERVRALYRVIEDHVMAQVAVAVNCSELEAWVPTMDVPQFLANPYHLAHKAIVNVTAQIQRQAGLSEKIDFVFDKRPEEADIQGAFKHYASTLPPDFAEVTGDLPIFRDDEDFLPLQAADLLAWWTRRQWLTDGTISSRWVPYPWPLRKDFPAIVLDLSGQELRAELERIEQYRGRIVRAPITMTVTFRSDLGPEGGGEKGGGAS